MSFNLSALSLQFPPLPPPPSATSSSTSLPLRVTSDGRSRNTSIPCPLVQQPWEDSRFNEANSDVQIRSADGFTFHLHRAVLEMNTGAFPGPDVPTDGEPATLTENANVLAILFSFIYPKRHPDLQNENFYVVSAVAEAAGKYEVFAAMNTCNTRLMKFLPQNALEIFVYAIRHDYPKLMNAAVPHFSRSPLVPVLTRIPPLHMLAWARYHEAWQAVFKSAIGYIKNLPAPGAVVGQCHEGSKAICPVCRCSLFTMISDLESIEMTSNLDTALKHPSTKYPFLQCCGNSNTNRAPCRHVVDLANLCKEKIKVIPTFASFLAQKE